MKRERRQIACLILLGTFGLGAPFVLSAPQEKLAEFQRDRVYGMLIDVRLALQKNYYDPSFHGVDLEGRLREAREKIEKASSLGQAFGAIAVALEELNDSHTRFYPPERPLTLDYGYRLLMNGNACLVSQVRAQTDAATKLHPGDQILTIEGFCRLVKVSPRLIISFIRFIPGALCIF